MSSQILIPPHTIKQYRQRTMDDSSRERHSDERVREIIFNSIISHKTWPTLEKLALEGVKARTTLMVRIHSFGNPLGKYRVVLVPSINIRGGYFVSTYKEINR